MSKKQLPKRNVSFKLEKHPTAERLEALRSQGIETVDDLDRISDQTIATPSFAHSAVPTAITEDQEIPGRVGVSSPVVIAVDPLIIAMDTPAAQKKRKTDSTSAISAVVETKSKLEQTTDIVVENNTENSETEKSITGRLTESSITTDQTSSTATLLPNKVYSDNIVTATNDTATSSSPLFSQTQTLTIPTTGATDTIKASATASAIPIDPTIETPGILENSHSSSANIIFRLLWQLAKQKSRSTIRVGTKELLLKTAIRSHVTIRKAIDELIIKRSIAIIEANQGKIPPVYRLFTEKEILKARRQADIEIDEDTRFAFIDSVRIWPASDSTATSIPTLITTQRTTDQTTTSHTTKAITSSTSGVKDELSPADIITKAQQIKEICQSLRITTDNEQNLLELSETPIEHIILGICKKLEKHQGAKTLSISDCRSEIKEHYDLMKALPEDMLAKVAYNTFAETVTKLKNHK